MNSCGILPFRVTDGQHSRRRFLSLNRLLRSNHSSVSLLLLWFNGCAGMCFVSPRSLPNKSKNILVYSFLGTNENWEKNSDEMVAGSANHVVTFPLTFKG